MAELISQGSVTAKLPAKQRATRLLDWLTKFLPTAIPSSPEQAIIDDSGDVNALLWHRSELENILQKTPLALTVAQKQQLTTLDTQIRQSALLIVGAEKGELRRFRHGHYDHSHWWWYLDDLLQEELMAMRREKQRVSYERVAAGEKKLLKVAEPRAVYGRRTNVRKKESK